MATDSCDHREYIVVYDTQMSIGCPVCDLEQEIKDLTQQVKDLESEIE